MKGATMINTLRMKACTTVHLEAGMARRDAQLYMLGKEQFESLTPTVVITHHMQGDAQARREEAAASLLTHNPFQLRRSGDQVADH